MTVAAVILAAGFSRRLGSPKQDLVLGDQTLLERAVRTAITAGLSPVVAVVREPHRLEPLQRLGAVAVLNEHAHDGMSTSVAAGVRQAGQVDIGGLVLLTCDQPLLRPAHLRALCTNPTRLTASAYAGRLGVPAFFPASTFPALLRLEGDRGARDLLADAASIPDEDLALDIDTEDDLRRGKHLPLFAP